MSEPEKPLHVRVAEALGWTMFKPAHGIWIWKGVNPDSQLVDYVPRYDTDWSMTGPLIERFKISLRSDQEPPTCGANLWEAYFWPERRDDGLGEEIVKGSTDGPLEAVCHLILALSEAGKLPR